MVPPALISAGLVAFACSSGPVGVGPDVGPEAGTDARASDTGATTSDTGASDAGAEAESTCEITRRYTVACGGDLNCGAAKFDAWCAQNDAVINSASYRRAESLCLEKTNCDPDKRRDCEYKTYATATPTTAQKAVATAYCQTCEPTDTSGCVTRKTTYDSSKGIKSVDDVFVAAWELADPIDDEIRTKCTGAVLDAGPATPDGGCLKAFASCAGNVYIDHLPDCPP